MRADGAIASDLVMTAVAAIPLLRNTCIIHLPELLSHLVQRRLHMAHDLLPQADPVVVKHENLAKLINLHTFVGVVVPQQLIIRQKHHTSCSILRGPLLHCLLTFALL